MMNEINCLQTSAIFIPFIYFWFLVHTLAGGSGTPYGVPGTEPGVATSALTLYWSDLDLLFWIARAVRLPNLLGLPHYFHKSKIIQPFPHSKSTYSEQKMQMLPTCTKSDYPTTVDLRGLARSQPSFDLQHYAGVTKEHSARNNPWELGAGGCPTPTPPKHHHLKDMRHLQYSPFNPLSHG